MTNETDRHTFEEEDMYTEQYNTSINSTNRKRKFRDEMLSLEVCRVCDDMSSGYHFGVFTCEACKGFFRRYSKKSNILEPCPMRCLITKTNRNNCAACRFDKCKYIGMALDKVRFGKPPKFIRNSSSSSSISTTKLEPTTNDFELMFKLLECYQSFEESEHQTSLTIDNYSSVIFQFCHRLACLVMQQDQCIPELFLLRLKHHELAIKFLITGENEPNSYSLWSKQSQAWLFAHNQRWRLILILLILAFNNENLFDRNDSIIIERILRLFELEYEREKCSNYNNEKHLKILKAQFLLRFIDIISNDMIINY